MFYTPGEAGLFTLLFLIKIEKLPWKQRFNILAK